MIRLEREDFDNRDKLSALATAASTGGKSCTPEEFDRFVKSEIAKWGKVIKAAGIKAN